MLVGYNINIKATHRQEAEEEKRLSVSSFSLRSRRSRYELGFFFELSAAN